MKILVTGAEGQLGRALIQLSGKKDSIVALDARSCDIVVPEQVFRCIYKEKPDAVIHCAAYTAVDLAEREREQCWKVNVDGTKNVVDVCRTIGASLMLLSTDYVFDGAGDQPYEPTARRQALNQYGRSKIAAEDLVGQLERHFIVRTSWMFGDGTNFVKRICQLGRTRQEVRVVSDQIGSPTYTKDLAPLLLEMAASSQYGIYHATNEGYCSWAGLAEESFHLMGIPSKVRRIPTKEYPSPAERPLNSRLSKTSLDLAGYHRLPTWQDALRRYIKEYGKMI